MRPSFLSVALLPVPLWTLVTARLHHSLVPEDPHAFPKYRVSFLNGLPLLNETAQRWLENGLHGGELEFLDQPWQEDAQWRAPQVKTLEGGSQEQDSENQDGATPLDPSTNSSFRLELMRMSPKSSYLCLIPPAPVENISVPIDESTQDVTPVHSWSLLQPLSGTCLYHKQGWFTYAYCHNSHVRQFHELQKPNAQRIGDYKPEEDTEWEAYTLGRAPPAPDPGADLTVAQEAAIAANVELARNAGHRYLVQRWGDGTYCEKISRKREIEIQFHCSMTMTDTILFVKETQTCHYVLHIATPRLCGEPGFRSRVDTDQEAYIRCREIVTPELYETIDRDLPELSQPVRMPKRPEKPIAAPSLDGATDEDEAQREATDPAEQVSQQLRAKQNELVRKALAKFMESGDLATGEIVMEDDDGEVIVGYIDLPEDVDEASATASLGDILRAAGFDIKGEKGSSDDKDDEQQRKGGEKGRGKQAARDEL